VRFVFAVRRMLCFLLENAEPGAASQNSTIDEKMFLARSLVEELHNPHKDTLNLCSPSKITQSH